MTCKRIAAKLAAVALGATALSSTASRADVLVIDAQPFIGIGTTAVGSPWQFSDASVSATINGPSGTGTVTAAASTGGSSVTETIIGTLTAAGASLVIRDSQNVAYSGAFGVQVGTGEKNGGISPVATLNLTLAAASTVTINSQSQFSATAGISFNGGPGGVLGDMPTVFVQQVGGAYLGRVNGAFVPVGHGLTGNLSSQGSFSLAAGNYQLTVLGTGFGTNATSVVGDQSFNTLLNIAYAPIASGGGGGGGGGAGGHVSGVPEPSTWAMMLIGFTGLAAAARHRKRAIAASDA